MPANKRPAHTLSDGKRMKKTTIIGVDGGASKVSAWQVIFNHEKKIFCLGELNAEGKYADIPGFLADFRPVDVAVQFRELADGAIRQTDEEKQQEAVYVEACARAIIEIARKSGADNLLIGIGMPGLKTSDQRGIHVVDNGPRMLNYSNLLEKRLELENINLAAPIARLGSDADYCGIGENYAEEGAFRHVQNAYYLGGGTGVADALKLKGALTPFDQTKSWLAKTWEMKYTDGRSLERFCSASGIQSIYADMSGKDIRELNAAGLYPPQIAQMAAGGDEKARATYQVVTGALAAIIYERIQTLHSGWRNSFEFMNPNRPPLESDHPFKGLLFERIILGQRLGQLFSDEAGKTVLAAPLLKALDESIQNSTVLTKEAKEHYRSIAEIVVPSHLREAPALGAGVDAFFAWENEG